MLMVFKGVKQEYVYTADTEYDDMKLIQSAGFVFKRVDDRNDIYQLAFSFNVYVKRDEVNKYVTKYTGITKEFLNENGMELEDFNSFYDEMFDGIDAKDVMFVSHGTQGDFKVLKTSGVSFEPEYRYCTYKNAKRILKREERTSLGAVSEEAGYNLEHEHNAYSDALATAIVFSFLKKLEWQES